MARSSVSRLKRKGRGAHRTTWATRIIPPRTRQALLSGASVAVLAAALIANPNPSFADDECDPDTGTATCTAAGGPTEGNPFEDGISYFVNDLTIVLESDVVIDTDANDEDGVSTIASGNLAVQGADGSFIHTVGDDASGVHASSSNGTVTVGVTTVTTDGEDSHGVYARSYGIGDYGAVSVTATGLISTMGDDAQGVHAYSEYGPVTVSVAAVTTVGAVAEGVFARSFGIGAYGAISVTATNTRPTSMVFFVGIGARSIRSDFPTDSYRN